MKIEQTDSEALTQLQKSCKDLVKLEKLANRFNIFTAVNLVEKELAHSDFLAWLIDPRGNHLFGTQFLLMLLEKVEEIHTKSNPDGLSSMDAIPIDMSSLDLSDCLIMREPGHIDILILSKKSKYICAVENKIHSSEHDDQLERYREHVLSEFPNHRHRFVFLTLWGQTPSCDYYLKLTHQDIADLIKALLDANLELASTEPFLLTRHYEEMVRRFLVKESEVQQLCRKIYREHKQAMDLIIQHGQVHLDEVHDMLIGLIKDRKDPELFLDYVTDDVNYVCFLPKEMDFIPMSDFPDAKDQRMLFFEFSIFPRGVDLNLYISPGDPVVRNNLYKIAKKKKALFPGALEPLCPDDDWHSLFSQKKWLTKKQIQSGDLAMIQEVLEKRFDNFCSYNLKAVAQYFVEKQKTQE